MEMTQSSVDIETNDDNVRNVDCFEFGQVLGEGGFGQVRLVVEKSTNVQYAAKILNKEKLIKSKQTKYVKSEKTILLSLAHPNVSKLYFTFADHKRLYFIMELITGGELFSAIRKLYPNDVNIEIAKYYLAEMCDALMYIHSKNVVHRDVKPENILLTGDGHLKLVDFGISKVMDGASALHTFCGTVEYLAPEVLKNEPYGKEVDWWAFGCVIFELLVGDNPFFASSQALTMKKIIEGDIYYPESLPEDARHLIENLLQPVVEKRFSGEDVRRHRFFHTIQWDELRIMTPPIIPDLMSDSEDEDDVLEGSGKVNIERTKKRRRGRKRNYLYAINKNSWRYMDQFSSLHHGIKNADTDDDMDMANSYSSDPNTPNKQRTVRSTSLKDDTYSHNHTDAKRRSEMLRLMYPEEMGKLPQRPNPLNANILEMSESLPVQPVTAEEVPVNNPVNDSSMSLSTNAPSPSRLPWAGSSTRNQDYFGGAAISGALQTGKRKKSRLNSYSPDYSLQCMEKISYGSRTPIKYITWMQSNVHGKHILASSGNFNMGIMQYDDREGYFSQHSTVDTGSSANYISFSPCGQYLAYDLQRHIGLLRRTEILDSSSGMRTIEFKQSSKNYSLRGHKLPITMVSWKTTGTGTTGAQSANHVSLLAAAGSDSFVYVWNVRNKGSKLHHVFQKSGHLSYISALEWKPDTGSNTIVSGGGDSRLIFYDSEACRITQKIDYHENAIVGLQFSPDGIILASHSLDRNLVFFDTRTWKIIKVLAHPSPVLYGRWSPDGKYFSSVSRDVIRIWSFPDLRCVKTLAREGTVNVQMVQFDASSRFLACSTSMSAFDSNGNSGNVPTVIDMQTMAICKTSLYVPSVRRDDIFAMDHELLAGEQQERETQEMAHKAPLTALCWSPNINSRGGPLLAAGSFDRSLSVWEVKQS